jgi:aarF domain-containing kinase
LHLLALIFLSRQVHRAVLADGTPVVVKVQYPGVADSIHSDLNNLRLLIKTFNVFPDGSLQPKELARGIETFECDYDLDMMCFLEQYDFGLM